MARQFQFDVQVGMVGINVPIPVPVAYYWLRRVEEHAVRRQPHVRPRGVGFYTHTKVVTARWPDPATSAVDLGFPLDAR